jgi:hypothetical protein
MRAGRSLAKGHATRAQCVSHARGGTLALRPGMRPLLLVIAIAVSGCCKPAALGDLSGGIAHPVLGDGRSTTGMCVQEMIGIGDCRSGAVAGIGVRYRKTGDTSELAWSVHEGAARDLGPMAAFARLSINLFEWDRIGTDDELGALGETFEIGLGRDDGTGMCVIGSVSHDVRFDYPHEIFVGVNVGMCGISTP